VNLEEYVLDTSAILTLMEDENGADRVAELLHEKKIWLPWLVLLEATYITRQEQGEAEATRRYALLKQLPAEIVWTGDEGTLLKAAQFKADYPISLADALIAAFADQKAAVLVHKDPEFELLDDLIPLEALPYKA
jgi:predicted nucleic acid-binding protein